MLDVLTGRMERMADTFDEFMSDVNNQWWQETYLFSELVYQLHQAGKVPGPGQCYALAPHPALGGPNPGNGDAIDPRFVMITDVIVWQSICAQLHGVVH
ncbi:MAG: T6SS immunity protein Tdi1 domain-containing protein [Gemmataceae bacterium]